MGRSFAVLIFFAAATALAEEPSSQPVPAPNELVTAIGPEDAPANLSELAASGYSGRDNALLHYGTAETFAELHGFLSVVAAQSNAPNSHLSIDLEEAFLSAFAQVNRDLTVYIEFEIKSGNVNLERGFVDWEFLPRVHLQAGKFYAPFGNDKLLLKQPFNKLTNNPLMMHNLGFDDFADIGAWLWASHRWGGLWIRGDFAVTKGASGLRDDDWAYNENNVDKPLFGRAQIGYDGQSFNGLVGASVAYGRYDDASRRHWLLVGAHAQAKLWRFELLAELMVRRGDDAIPSALCDGHPCVLATANGIGLYAQLSFHALRNRKLAHDLELIVRYDQSELTIPGETATATYERRLTFGARWKPYSHFALKAQYDLARSEPYEVHGGGFEGGIVVEF